MAIACFAGGVFLGVGSLVLLAYNGLAIGAFAGHFANVGLLEYLLTFILGHGALELFAIWVAGRTDRVLREEDSSKNVIDELPGYLVAVFGLPLTWQIIVAAFFLERVANEMLRS